MFTFNQRFKNTIQIVMKKYILFLVIAFGLGASYSCYSPPGFGTGKIIVVDEFDFRVPSATVMLSQPGQLGTGYIINEGLTNMSGEYSYTHEPALEVILDISVTEGIRSGEGIIRIKPDETSTEIVTIY